VTAHPSTYYKCDRCSVDLHVEARTNPPEHKRMSGPEGWCQLRIGDDPATPPAHLCELCTREFNVFMQGPLLREGGDTG
jgi:hypothetical protein